VFERARARSKQGIQGLERARALEEKFDRGQRKLANLDGGKLVFECCEQPVTRFSCLVNSRGCSTGGIETSQALTTSGINQTCSTKVLPGGLAAEPCPRGRLAMSRCRCECDDGAGWAGLILFFLLLLMLFGGCR
jgi:hypothetical protein